MSYVVNLLGAKLHFPQALQYRSRSGRDDWLNEDFALLPVPLDIEVFTVAVRLLQPLIVPTWRWERGVEQW
ncbi:MAG: hypothetical protein VXW65_06910, partial [Pseudomonadota bacterium]|nr:hypothetical protein [Pseudomonadota bacterium]